MQWKKDEALEIRPDGDLILYWYFQQPRTELPLTKLKYTDVAGILLVQESDALSRIRSWYVRIRSPGDEPRQIKKKKRQVDSARLRVRLSVLVDTECRSNQQPDVSKILGIGDIKL
jgi:hypothetical protein